MGMNNPLKSEKFNRHDATKDRSPGFRAFVIFLLLVFITIIIYTLAVKNSTGANNNIISQPESIMSK